MSSMIDDAALVRRAVAGDRKAFEMIVRKYQQPLLNYMGRMVGERELALDFTQDVFVKAYSSLPSFRPEYKFTTWLFKIASNHVIDYWRRKKIAAVSLDQPVREDDDALTLQVADDGPSIDRRFELEEMRRKVEAALEDVPAGLRELFVLRHVNEFSYEEIAEIKRLPVGTVKNRVFQAKEMLKRMLWEAEA